MSFLLQIYSFLQSTTGFKSFGKRSMIKFPFKVWGKKYIDIGKDVFIAENSFLCAVDNYNNYTYHPHISIGDHVTIGSNFFVTSISEVAIKDNVLISDRVFIGDNIHDYRDIKKPIIDQKVASKGKVYIGEGSFIGVNAVILPNVNIGKHVVVGASAVVTKDIPDFTVVSGNPARIIKKYNYKRKKWEKIK